MSVSGGKKVLFVIYNEIGLFPPTLNAIELTAEKVQQVFAVELVTQHTGNEYSQQNIQTYSIPYVSGSPLNSVRLFFQFVKTIRQILQREQPGYIVIYDSMAAMAIQLISLFKPLKAELWFHSHDVIDDTQLPRFSLLHASVRFQKKIIRRSKIFSLPAEERKQFYPSKNFTGRFACIPNFPSKRYYASHTATNKDSTSLRVIYQGRITAHHGLEEVIELLPNQLNGKELRLIIKGIADPAYKRNLDDLIMKQRAEGVVEFHGLTSYQALPAFTSQSHIGLAVYTREDIMNTTLGTASNKVYEYTACGMPFLYFRNNHFEHYFRDMPWAVPTDLSAESLLQGILHIDRHYNELSALAKQDFLARRNYEAVFTPVLNYFLSEEIQTYNTNG